MLLNALLVFVLILVLMMAVTVFAHIFFLVPYVPTRKRVMEKMIEAAKLKPRETVMDIGCGDGRLLFAAEKKAEIRAIGFEIAPLIFLLAYFKKLIVRSRAKIFFKNFLKANLAKANVIFCYLIPSVMPTLADKIKRECKKGTRIISNTFHIPGFKPYKILKKNPSAKIPTIYVYRI